MVEILKDFPFTDWIARLQRGIYTYKLTNAKSEELKIAYADTMANAAYQLYKKIFKPIESAFDLPSKFIVMPDGELGYLPFEMLISALPDDYTIFGSYAYLINDYQISYAPSATFLKEMQNRAHSKTKELMEHFYGYLKDGNTKDAALRQAKLDFIEKYAQDASPYYWAAFVPMGDMNAIELGADPNWQMWGAIVLLLSGVFFYFAKKR